MRSMAGCPTGKGRQTLLDVNFSRGCTSGSRKTIIGLYLRQKGKVTQADHASCGGPMKSIMACNWRRPCCSLNSCCPTCNAPTTVPALQRSTDN